ncbi:MAG: hypothetical protein HYW06_10980 [Gemmatimonadetes bacterium]|nr:hypothetical protein [Gemmatimonadota bacterium]
MRRSAGSSSSGGWSYRRPLSLLLITAYVVMFGWELSAGALESQESIVAAGALYRPPVRDGKLWRLLSAGFTRSAVVYLSGIGGLRDKRIAVVLLAVEPALLQRACDGRRPMRRA